MIKWIKSQIEKVFRKKKKPEPEPEPETVKEVVIAEPEKIQCNSHSRFIKSSPICVEAAK